MDKIEIEALKKTGAIAPSFKINRGSELDYLLAITMARKTNGPI